MHPLLDAGNPVRADMKEAYIYGCGTCGRELYLKADLSIESRAAEPELAQKSWLPEAASEPCEYCLAVIAQADDEAYPEMTTQTASTVGISGHGNLITESLNRLMGWCQCGNPEDMTAMAFLYLTAVGNKLDRKTAQEKSGIPDEAWTLLSYICDYLEWTEHGGSVGGAWLTDTGKEALRKYTEKRKSEERET